jgi:hypothetical protein
VIIAQLLLDGASEYERKSQRLDFASLAAHHDVRLGDIRAAQIVHVYAAAGFDGRAVRDLTVPYVCNVRPKPRRFRQAAQPQRMITPVQGADGTTIPEAVEDLYFEPPPPRTPGNRLTIGSYIRPTIRNVIELTAARIQRVRDDVDWLLFDAAPSPADLHGVDVWADPAVSEDDFDGFVAEAVVSGTAVVAARTAINTQRLEKGRTGFLVPLRDPNEWTHAILSSLFKQELRQTKMTAATQTVSKFRARQRAGALTKLYESILQ